MSEPPVRVCIDARVVDGTIGGTQQAIMGLARGLRDSSTAGRDLDLFFLVWKGHTDWLAPHLPEDARLIEARRPTERLRRLARRVPGLRPAWRAARRLFASQPRPPASDGCIERAGIQVMHFTQQYGFRTAVPSIYRPQDLQHVHLPGNFSAADWRLRDGVYRWMCAQASVVTVPTEWGARDLMAQYGLSPDRVVAVPPGAAAAGEPPAAMDELASRLRLPARYALYPAQTWPHKNHRRLIEALASLRQQREIAIPLVCTGGTGGTTGVLPKLQALAASAGVEVRFMGYLSPADLEVCYRRATLLVFPSLFEGWGMPVTEAMSFGVPVACADTTALPFTAGGAARLFDPTDTEAMAGAIAELWSSHARRAELAAAGRARVASLRWSATAERCADLYRMVSAAHPR
jgi:glycosyltransferase involved in cell wall biosynthesis